MLPPKTDFKWKQLLIGEMNYQFKAVAAGLIVSRLSRSVKQDTSTENINKCIDEVYTFFIKYEKVFKDDIEAIFGKEN